MNSPARLFQTLGVKMVERASRQKNNHRTIINKQNFGFGHMFHLANELCKKTRHAKLDEASREFCLYLDLTVTPYHVGNLEEMSLLAEQKSLVYELHVDTYRGSAICKMNGYEDMIARTPALALAAAILVHTAKTL